MPRHGVTKEQVAQATVALREAGHPVTTTNVRSELGKGSMSTIGRHLDALGAKERGKRLAASEVMPSALRAVCDGFVQRTWTALHEHARAREEAAAHPLRVRVQKLTRALAQARERYERAEWEAQELRHELHEAQAQVSALEAQLVQAKAELAVERRIRDEQRDRPAHGLQRQPLSRRTARRTPPRATE